MLIELLIHIERVENETVWWAESPQLAGFTAADKKLQSLLLRSKMAIAELAELGEIEPDYEVAEMLSPLPPMTSNDDPSPDSQQSAGEPGILAFA